MHFRHLRCTFNPYISFSTPTTHFRHLRPISAICFVFLTTTVHFQDLGCIFDTYDVLSTLRCIFNPSDSFLRAIMPANGCQGLLIHSNWSFPLNKILQALFAYYIEALVPSSPHGAYTSQVPQKLSGMKNVHFFNVGTSLQGHTLIVYLKKKRVCVSIKFCSP